ncbi:MAG: hypothetical protein AB7Q17_03825 [Phycisphaerae bacterium]
MPTVRTLLAITSLLAAVGCAPPMRVAPGLAGVRVHVRATPKAGYVPPSEDVVVDSYGRVDMLAPDVPATGPFAHYDYRALDGVVVALNPAATTPSVRPPPVSTVTISPQSGDGAAASVTGMSIFAASVGGTLTVRNGSSTAESVYSVSPGNRFDLGTIAPGASASHTLTAAGIVEVLADSRDAPLACVYVAPTPWVSIARAGSRVDFPDVPPGRCVATAWHPRLPGMERTLELVADRATETTLTISVNALPKAR